ncbi:MAG: hypothetical protein ORN26_00215 [Candidatus Pacebacteria bacterium]|nr:hypothetical protein [Candidatus Paceibacterota bacterium]
MSLPYPRPTISNATTSQTLSNLTNSPTSLQLLGQFTISANSIGNININKISFITTVNPTFNSPNPITFTITNAQLFNDSGANNPIRDSSNNTLATTSITSGTSYSFTSTPGITILAGQSKTFYLFANVSYTIPVGYGGPNINVANIDTKLDLSRFL